MHDLRRDTGQTPHGTARGLPLLARIAIAGAAVAALAILAPLRSAAIAVETAIASTLFCLSVAAGVAVLPWLRRRRSATLDVWSRVGHRVLERWGWAVAILVTLLPIWSHWAQRPPSLISAIAALAGHLPWLDGEGHVEGGMRVLAEGRFGPFSGRRPLTGAWLGVRLALTGGSVPWALLVQAVVVGWAVWLFTRLVALRFGLAAAIGCFALTVALVRDYLPTVATEPLGVTFACLAGVVLVSRVARTHLGLAAAGVFGLDLALQARPGAQFVLPAVLLWTLWLFRRRWRRAVLVLVPVALAGTFGSAALNRAYGTEDASMASYPAYTLYGLARDSNYRQAFEDFPAEMALREGRETEIARFLYRKAAEAILHDPGPLLRRLARNGGKFFGKLPPNLTRLVTPEAIWTPALRRLEPGPGATRRNRWLGGPFLIAGLVAFSLHLGRTAWPERLFWLALIGGVLASVPFVYGDAGLRGLAAVFPFLALLFTIGLSPGSRAAEDDSVERSLVRTAIAAGGVLLAACALGPAIGHAFAPRPARESIQGLKPGSLMVVSMRYATGLVVGNRARGLTGYPTLGRRAFGRHLDIGHFRDGIDFESRATPYAVLSVYDFVSRRQRNLVAPVELLRQPGFVRVAVKRAEQSAAFFEALEWQPVAARGATR